MLKKYKNKNKKYIYKILLLAISYLLLIKRQRVITDTFNIKTDCSFKCPFLISVLNIVKRAVKNINININIKKININIKDKLQN